MSLASERHSLAHLTLKPTARHRIPMLQTRIFEIRKVKEHAQGRLLLSGGSKSSPLTLLFIYLFFSISLRIIQDICLWNIFKRLLQSNSSHFLKHKSYRLSPLLRPLSAPSFHLPCRNSLGAHALRPLPKLYPWYLSSPSLGYAAPGSSHGTYISYYLTPLLPVDT